MAVSDDRKYTSDFVYHLLEGVIGKTLGGVDSSNQFARTAKSSKITGIAGDVIEQSVFRYARDSKQECDIEVDGQLTELKTTGVRVPKTDLKRAQGKTGDAYNVFLGAKEGISITGVTFEPAPQTDFFTSHFWEKAEHLLIVFYEYKSYDVVPAADYAHFPIVGYCYNRFSANEQAQLRSDWEIVRDYLLEVYSSSSTVSQRNARLVGFTHQLRPQLMLIELVPGFKPRPSGGYQRPRYRLKQTFIDYIVRGHFSKNRQEVSLKQSFSNYSQLDARCHELTKAYGGQNLSQLQKAFHIIGQPKNLAALSVLHMFGAECKRLNQIADFTKVGILAKTITLTPEGYRTEDMKLQHVDFDEWSDRDVDFEDSGIYRYFCEHCFLFPVFCEHEKDNPNHITFKGFKRMNFDEAFIQTEVRRMWEDSRRLIHNNELKWIPVLDRNGQPKRNPHGGFMGAPNLPKSSAYTVFMRGGANDSSVQSRTECVNGISMLPQFFWIKGAYIANKLKDLPYT